MWQREQSPNWLHWICECNMRPSRGQSHTALWGDLGYLLSPKECCFIFYRNAAQSCHHASCYVVVAVHNTRGLMIFRYVILLREREGERGGLHKSPHLYHLKAKSCENTFGALKPVWENMLGMMRVGHTEPGVLARACLPGCFGALVVTPHERESWVLAGEQRSKEHAGRWWEHHSSCQNQSATQRLGTKSWACTALAAAALL